MSLRSHRGVLSHAQPNQTLQLTIDAAESLATARATTASTAAEVWC